LTFQLAVLQELPASIGRLSMLTILNVDRNQLTEIPREVHSRMMTSRAPACYVIAARLLF